MFMIVNFRILDTVHWVHGGLNFISSCCMMSYYFVHVRFCPAEKHWI